MTDKEKQYKQEIKCLRKELDQVLADRRLFREHFTENFRWYIRLCGENKYPNMISLVESEAKWLRRFTYWYW
jgi:hypothetical protein